MPFPTARTELEAIGRTPRTIQSCRNEFGRNLTIPLKDYHNSSLFINLDSCSESEPVNNNQNTYSVRKNSKPYRDWLADKKFMEQERQQKEEMEKLQYEFEFLSLIEYREKQSKINYENWLFRKQAEEQEQKNQIQRKIENEKRLARDQKKNYLSSLLSVADWTEDKITQENQSVKERKAKLAEEKRKQQEMIKIRKVKSEHELRKWTSTLCLKSKPVPLNRGLDSLKGCISDIYENPIPWNNLVD